MPQELTSAPSNSSSLGLVSVVVGSSPDTLMGLAKAPLPVAAELCGAQQQHRHQKVRRWCSAATLVAPRLRLRYFMWRIMLADDPLPELCRL